VITSHYFGVMMDLPEKIRYIRKLKGLSQAGFALELGLERSSISKIETGKLNPSQAILVAICIEFDVSLDWLLEEKGEFQKRWTRKDVLQLPLKARSIITRKTGVILKSIAEEAMAKAADRWLILHELLGEEIWDLAREDLTIGDSVVFDTVRQIYLKVEAAASRPERVKKKLEIERAVLCFLDAIDIDSRKDVVAFLLGKVSQLRPESQKKLEAEIRCLKEAEQEKEDF
jgi:transcriptional regulator with XRE-family HTH domain